MGRYATNGGHYGKMIVLIGLLMSAPLAVLPFYPEEIPYATSFFIPALMSFVIGFIVCLYETSKEEEKIMEWQSSLQKGSVPVMFVWCFAFLAGAVPFIISGKLDFTLALFESVSGWTTTGLTVVDVTAMPHIFLFHRSFMQYCGGLGFIIMIAMLVHGKQAMSLYSAEGHADKLLPSLKGTARTIFLLYFGFMALGTLLYRIFGMGLFDAVCHTMSALSTAGFTTRAGSIGEYNSLAIEAVTILLMLIGSLNFAILLLLVRGKFRQLFMVSELRFMFGLIAVFVALTALSLYKEMGMSIGESIRNALFGVVTIFSTTGYSTMNYAGWPQFAVGLLLMLMIIGGSAGSTAGGIKMIRAYLLVRTVQENIRGRLSPARNVTTPSYYKGQVKTPIDESVVRDTTGFIACYIGILIAGTLLITIIAGCPLLDAMYEFASAFGTVGVSNGMTNAATPPAMLYVEIAGMILGRLEIFIVFIGVYSYALILKRKAQKFTARYGRGKPPKEIILFRN